MTKSTVTKDIAYYMGLPYSILMNRDEEGDFVAHIQEMPGCMADGLDPTQAVNRLREVQEAWIAESLESDRPVPEPELEEELPSGKWVQRVPRTLHRRLAELAKREEVSLNQLVTSMLAEATGIRPWRDSPNPVLQGSAPSENRERRVGASRSRTTRGRNRSKPVAR